MKSLAGISDLKSQSNERGVAARKRDVNIFVRVGMRKEASGGDNGRQEATGKGADGKNRQKRGYNRCAREVGVLMKRDLAS